MALLLFSRADYGRRFGVPMSGRDAWTHERRDGKLCGSAVASQRIYEASKATELCLVKPFAGIEQVVWIDADVMCPREYDA